MSTFTIHRCIAGAVLTTSMLCAPGSAHASAPVEPVITSEAPTSLAAPAPAAAPAPEARPRGLVVSATLGVNFVPVFPVPSGELSLFLGGALPIKTFRPSHWLALGYRGTVGVGYADVFTGGLVGLHHHLALQGVAGKRARFYYGLSAGVAQFPGITDDTGLGKHSAFALEGEGRLGGLFGARDLKFLFGAQIRATRTVGSYSGSTPIPTVGLFFGVNFGPRMRAR